MFKTIGKHVPPPPGMPSPVLWGDEATVRARVGEGTTDLQVAKRMYPFRYPFPPPEVVEFFRTYYGPANRAFATLDGDGQADLRRDLEQLWSAHNRSRAGGTELDAEYLEIIATRG
jgi:hypothetical protein